MAGYYLFCCLLNISSVIRPVPKSIEPPTNGKPAETKSFIFEDQRNGKQNNIPERPASIVIIAIALITVLVILSVMFLFTRLFTSG